MAEGGFLDNIVSAWGDEEVVEEDLYPDETRSPNVNILIRSARKYLDDKLSKEEFLDEVDSTLERLEQALTEHRTLYENPSLTDEIRSLADAADDAYEEFRAGLVEMASGDRGAVEQGIETCKKAAQALEDTNDRFVDIQQREQMIECLMCGYQNEPNFEECIKCGAVLPRTMQRAAADYEDTSSDMVMVPEEYIHLYEACDRVAADEIPLADWQVHVDAFCERFKQAARQIKDHTRFNQQQLKQVPGLLDDADRVVESLEEALEALDRMQRFADDRDPEHLNQGWMDLLAATQRVQHHGSAFYRTLETVQEAEGAETG